MSMNASQSRDVALDIARGLAIFLMVMGNISGSIYPHPYPRWGDILIAFFSFVPALFVMLSGMSVAYTSRFKPYTLKHYLVRGALLIVAAAFILDALVWGIVPFLAMEILYLIGLAIPASFLFMRLDRHIQVPIAILTLFLGPILQRVAGYSLEGGEIPLGDIAALQDVSVAQVLQHWFVDGWFPVFPWLGFAFLGVLFVKDRWGGDGAVVARFNTSKWLLSGTFLMVGGILLWYFTNPLIYARSGFGEVIYPPSWAYIVTATGQILLLLAALDSRMPGRISRALVVYGQSSLFMYWFHFTIIEYLPLRPSLPTLFVIFGATLLVLFALAYALRWLRKRFPHRPVLLKYVVGV